MGVIGIKRNIARRAEDTRVVIGGIAVSLYDLLLDTKNLDAYPRLQQKEILRRLAFAYYIRKGAVPGWVVTLQKLAEIAPPDFKFNPWHDDLGRFTSGPNSDVKPISDATGSSQAPNSWGNPKTLQSHFEKHGEAFDAKSPEDYAEQAGDFYQRAAKGEIPAVRASDGIVRAYDPSTNTFGSYNSDGTTRTFFKPTNGARYFQEQASYDLSQGGQVISSPTMEPLSEGEGGGGGGGGGGYVDIFHPHTPMGHTFEDELEE